MKCIDKIKELLGIEEERVYEIPELDEIAEVAEGMDSYFNVKIDKNMTLPMVLIGNYGMHIFIDLGKNAKFDEIRPLINKVVYKYHLDPKTTFWGISEGLKEVYITQDRDEFVISGDIVSKFENFYINAMRSEIEKVRLGLDRIEDLIKSENELEDKKNALLEECIISTEEQYVKENLSDEMVEYYKSLIESNEENSKNFRTDENGNEYVKHETRMKVLGITTGEGFYRVSEEDEERTFYITLFGGIFGLHHLIRGDFFRAVIYLLTGGGFGALYLADVISVCGGSYCYDEVKYGVNEYGKQIRNKEKVYLRPIEGVKKKIGGPLLAILISILYVSFVIKPGYIKANENMASAAKEYTNEYIENRYEEITNITTNDLRLTE